MEHIAFLGLGKMGTGMAGNLLKLGFTLAVYNRTRDKADALRDLGARVADTARDAAKDADVIIAMVADDVASRAIWLGENGALAGAKAGALLIECSTLTPAWVRELAEQAKKRGCDMVDAPVRGGPSNAAAGQITMLAGGEPKAFERARPILSKMTREVEYLGAIGNGAAMKLLNNMMIAVEVELFSEALLLAERAGLNVKQAAKLLSEGGPGSRAIQHHVENILERNFAPQFELRLMHKDMSYALEEAVRCDVPLPTVAASREIYRLAIARGFGEMDWAAVGEALR
jgi:3-hydroxyisobutyrate dehydrogenase